MSFRIKHCVSARSDHTILNGLTKSNYHFKNDNHICTQTIETEQISNSSDLNNIKTEDLPNFIYEKIGKLEDYHNKVTTNYKQTLEKLNKLEDSHNKVNTNYEQTIETLSKLEDSHSKVIDNVNITNELYEINKSNIHNHLSRLDETLSKLEDSHCEVVNEINNNIQGRMDAFEQNNQKLEQTIRNLTNDGTSITKVEISDKFINEKIENLIPKVEKSMKSILEKDLKDLEKLIDVSINEKIKSIPKDQTTDKSIIDKINPIETKLNKLETTIKDRLSNIEIKHSKNDISKLLSDRVSALEIKKVIPKSIIDRITSLETLDNKIKTLEMKIETKIDTKIEPSQELLSLIKTLSDRIVSLETESMILKTKLDSIAESEDYSTTNLQSPSSTSSNSLVHI